MPPQEQYYVDALGNKQVINTTGSALAWNSPEVMGQKFNYQTQFNPNTALSRQGGFNVFGTNWFGTDKLNLTPAQLNALNVASNGQWGMLSQADQIRLAQQDGFKNIFGAQTNGQAQQQWNALSTQVNNNKWTTQDTLGAIGMGINAATSLYGIYNAHKQLGLAKQALAEKTALDRANFTNMAKTINNQYRDKFSGRGHVGMNSSARTALGRAYDKQKVRESY